MAAGGTVERREATGSQSAVAGILTPISSGIGHIHVLSIATWAQQRREQSVAETFWAQRQLGGLEAADCARGLAVGRCMSTMITTE